MKHSILLLLTIITSYCSIHIQAKDLDYIKNLGQWNSKVNYKADIRGGHVYLENQHLTYTFFDAHSLHEIHELEHKNYGSFTAKDYEIDAYAFKVEFLNSNPKPTIVEGNTREGYYNYFLGNNTNTWASKVPLFDQIKYESIYEGINLIMYSEESNLKYDFHVAINSDPRQIKLKYHDLDNVHLAEGALHIELGFNTIIEQKPYAYQLINGEIKEVVCEYNLSSLNELSFVFPNSYDKTHALVIDPVLIAATLSGSNVTNYGHSATYDTEGNIYTGARNFGSGYPTTTGAYQLNYGGGGTDIAISKLNPDGSILIWATYIGGNNSEYPHSMFVQDSELYVLGSSSSSDYPTSSNAFDNSNSSTDIVISHLSDDGANLIGSTFVGGSGIDGTNNIYTNYADTYRGEIIVDSLGNAYVASFSQSTNFPTTENAYQTTLGGSQDGVVFKMNPDLSSLIWSTYIGGGSDDSAYGLRQSQNGDIYVTGSAGDDSFPTTPTALSPNFIGGSNDGFVAQFSPDGSTLLNSTFYGTNAKDQSFFLDIDFDGDIYIYGQNEGALTVSPTCYGDANSAQFVSKLSPDLQNLLWQTTIGSGSIGGGGWSVFDFVPIAFMVDMCKRIYISGHGASSGSELYVSPSPIFATGGFYEMVLEENATAINYATFYTGDHVDGGTSRFDPNGIIYQAVCSGGGFSTTANAYSSTQSSGWDIGVFKIELSSAPLSATASANPSTIGCAPFPITFNNTSSPGTYTWDFDDGSGSTATNPSHLFTNPGNYNVELIVVDPESCSFSDTLILPIEVIPSPNLSLGDDLIICQGDTVSLLAISNAAEFLWQDNSTNQYYETSTPGTYIVEASIEDCSITDTIEVIQDPFILDLGPNLVLCSDSPITTLDAGSSAILYQWSTGEQTPTINVSSGVYSVVVTSDINCEYQDEIEVDVQEFSLEISSSSQEECVPANIEFNDLSIVTNGEIISWDWDFQVTTSINSNPSTYYTSPGFYDINLITSTIEGCEDTLTLIDYIQINPNPEAEFNYGIEFQNSCDIGIQFNNLSQGATNFQWDFNNGQTSNLANPNEVFEYNQQFEVILEVFNEFSCSDLTARILEIPKFKPVYVPNVFTPNNDLVNDLFKPVSACIEKLEFRIYDRWGKLVFFTKDIYHGWDGTFDGILLANDTYAWQLKYDHDGEDITEHGFVLLLQ